MRRIDDASLADTADTGDTADAATDVSVVSMAALRASQRTSGYPSPAEDFVEATLDIRDLLIKHPAATFFVQVDTPVLRGAGVHRGDILVVDRALTPVPGAIVVATSEGELVVRRYVRDGLGGFWLQGDPPDAPPTPLTRGVAVAAPIMIWGVVTFLVRASLPGKAPCLLPSR